MGGVPLRDVDVLDSLTKFEKFELLEKIFAMTILHQSPAQFEKPCLLYVGGWSAHARAGKYGHLQIKKGIKCWSMVHRIVCHLMVLKLVDNRVSDHLCIRPECVEPTHLMAKTQSQNLTNRTPSKRLSVTDKIQLLRSRYNG